MALTSDCTLTHRLNRGGVLVFKAIFNPLDIRITTSDNGNTNLNNNPDLVTQFSFTSFNNSGLTFKIFSGSSSILKPCTTYYVYAREVTTSYYLTSFTTPPPRPVITYTTIGNKLNVSWKLEENTTNNKDESWSKIYINLYKAETPDIIFKNVTLYSKEIGNKQSGDIEFVLESGNYIIKAQTIYEANGVEIPCCTDSLPTGVDRYEPSGEYGTEFTAYKYVSDEIRVSGFDWTYSHTDIYGNLIEGTDKIINRNEQKYFYITANEWNALCDYVKSLIWDETVIGKSIYGYSATTTYGELVDAARVTQDDPISAKKFNMLRYCIGSHISTQGTVIAEDFESNADIYDEYFNTLKEYANKLITIKS